MSQVTVATSDQLDQAITQYIAQGYTVANRTPKSATMMKKKEFNILWAVIGFFLCLLPLLIYCIVYATEQDKMVEIRVDPTAALSPSADVPTLSADGRFWWDGNQWQDAQGKVPSTASRSEDGTLWWDGATWRPVPKADPLTIGGDVVVKDETVDSTAEAVASSDVEPENK